MLHDLRFALRQLRRTPGFAIVTVLTLGLGMGANAAVFSVMNAVVLRFLPVHDPDRLVFLHTSRQPNGASQTGFDNTSLSFQVYEQLATERAVFSELMAYVPLGTGQVAARYGSERRNRLGRHGERQLLLRPRRRRWNAGAASRSRTRAQHTQNAVISHALLDAALRAQRGGARQHALRQGRAVHDRRHHGPGVRRTRPTGDRPTSGFRFRPAPELKPWGRSPDSSETFYNSPNWWFLLTVGRLAPGVDASIRRWRSRSRHSRAPRTPRRRRAAAG